LKEDFYLKRGAAPQKTNLISIVFNSYEVPTENIKDKEQLVQFSNANNAIIQVASSSIGTETFFQANTDVRFVVIGMAQSEIDSLLQIEQPNKQVQTILDNNTTFFFHERMSPEINRIYQQLFWNNENDNLPNLFYHIKIQELIYLLFNKLLGRESA